MKSYIERAIELAKSKRQHDERSAQPVEGQLDVVARDNVKRRRPHVIAHAAANGRPVSTGNLPPIDLTKTRAVVTDGGLLRHNRVLVESDPMEPVANAYRMLRTRVMRQMRMNGWRRLGITASAPGEGKTLTAINLALAIAAEHTQPVVLIDMDLRRSRIHHYLGLEVSKIASVGDYLEGRTSSLDQLVVTLSEQGLSCILNSRPIERSSDLLASPQGQAFLNDLSSCLPDALLIFDLPPLLSTDDPLVVAPMLDALLLVVAENGALRSEVASAAKLLAEFNLLGTVLNKSVERSDPGYYGY